jgi:LDH2 family malate/lactate/ureidoglycolate dehydrogenase
VTDPAELRKAGDADLHPSTPPVFADQPPRLRKGSNTADSVGSPDRDKLVEVSVRVPKSLRKLVRAEAKRRGITLDQLVAEALRERTAR